jgi:hypothetical protein
MLATCSDHLILFGLIILIILGEVHMIWSSSLCSFYKSPIISSLLSRYILLRTLFSDALIL